MQMLKNLPLEAMHLLEHSLVPSIQSTFISYLQCVIHSASLICSCLQGTLSCFLTPRVSVEKTEVELTEFTVTLLLPQAFIVPGSGQG